MIRMLIILLLLSYPIFGAEQYTETACLLLKQQATDYERRLGRESPLYDRSKANFDIHCKKPVASVLKKGTVLSNTYPKQNSKPIFTQPKQQTATKIKPIVSTKKQVPKTIKKPIDIALVIMWPFVKMLMILLVSFSVFIAIRHFVIKKLRGVKGDKEPIRRAQKSSSPNSNYSNGPSNARRAPMDAAGLKGLAGEMEVNQGLHLKLDKSVYTNHSDITLPLEDGGTTQVDHIVVSDFGIFVIETKNMTGWIFGNEKQRKWTQTIGRSRHPFQNPLRQNYMHTKTLANLLDLPHEYFQSIVVFTSKAKLKTRMPENVGHLDEMINYLLSFDKTVLKEISKIEVSTLIDKIKLASGHTTNRDHVDYLKEKHK